MILYSDLREKEGCVWVGGGGWGAWKGEGRDNFILGLISEECTHTPSLN